LAVIIAALGAHPVARRVVGMIRVAVQTLRRFFGRLGMHTSVPRSSMRDFKVTVAFHSMVRQDLGSSVSARLPQTVQLGSLQIVRDTAGDRYTVQVPVSAESGAAAMALAVDRVREVLFVLATLGDAYEIEYWPSPRVEAVEVPPTIDKTASGVHVAIDEIVTVTDHASVVVERVDYTRQASAVNAADTWPEWLRVALALNYSAVTAREDRPALVGHWSALEIVVNGTQGTPEALVNTRLGKAGAGNLYRLMVEWLQSNGLSKSDSVRVADQARNAHLEGTLDRTRRCLEGLGVQVTLAQLRFVSKSRGTVVHAGSSSDEQVKQALEAVRGWLRQALPALLARA
jgi:hypothetical protein